MQSLLDQVNILIKMKVGDPYRLEHIKLMLKQKRTVYGSDRAYLVKLIHEYIEQVKTQKKLAKIRGENLFEEDSETDSVVMIGEIGGTSEEEAAEFISSSMSKPVVAYIAGVTAPPGKKMGHAGAIVSGNKGTAKAKIDALSLAGATVVSDPTEIGIALRSLL